MAKIHPLAAVDPKARLGENVEIGPFCNVTGDVTIGDNTRLISNVTVMDGARIRVRLSDIPGRSHRRHTSGPEIPRRGNYRRGWQ